jgi:GT2 family glycosyltransferase
VIACCDRLPLLRLALASVDAQTFRDFEIVLVDDASTDGTTEWAARRAPPGLRLARNPRRLGPSRSRNLGVALSRGELIAFLDHDDLWRPRYLAAMARAFRRPETMYACSDNDVIDGRGRVRIRRTMRRAEYAQPAFTALSGLPRVPSFSAVTLRRSAWEAVGGLDEGFKLYCDDSDLAFRLGLAYGPGAFAFVDEVLVSRRLSRGRGPQISRMFDPLGPSPVEALRRRWPRLDARRRDILFDIVLQHRKHRWWLDRLVHG